MAEITKELSDLLKEVGESTDINNPSSAVWALPQRRSTIVVKHKALEKIAVLKGMSFKPPTIIETNSEKGIIVVCVEGEKTENGKTLTAWSFGEVSKSNYDPSRGGTKNVPSYPYSMAEKRAVDRCVLKLLGMHGNYYSEAEADAFEEDESRWGNKQTDKSKEDKSFDKQINKLKDKKESSKKETSVTSSDAAQSSSNEKEKEKSSSELSDNDNVLHKVFTTFLDDCNEIPKLYEFWKSNQVQLDKLKNDDEEQYEKIKSSFTNKKIQLQEKE